MKNFLEYIINKLSKTGRKGNFNFYQYVGTYTMDDDCAVAEVSLKENSLFMTFTEKPDFNEALSPLEDHKFCFTSDPDKNTMLRFKEDKNGNIISLEFLNYTFKKQTTGL